MLFDLILIVSVFMGVYYFRFGYVSSDILLFPALWLIALFVLCSFYIFGTYELDTGDSALRVMSKTGMAILVGLAIIVVINYLFANVREGLFGRGVLIGSFFIFGVIAVIYRIPFVHFFNSFRAELSWLLMVEDKDLDYIRQDIQRRGLTGQITVLTKTGAGCQGNWESIDILLNKRWSGVICALSPEVLAGPIGQTLMKAKLIGHNIIAMSKFSEQHWGAVLVHLLNPEWFIAADSFNLVHHPAGLRLKRLTDISLSTILLLVTWPLMIICMAGIAISRGPIIYTQIRTGKDGRPFKIFKFRSMVENAELNGVQWAQKNDARVTKWGKFMRLSRLDELPQLFNVFKGDMSFVGPRPERPELDQLFEPQIPYYRLRNLVRPGITGWAQVCYPYGASVEDAREKLQYDLYYIKYFSFTLDFIIILRTIRVVLFRQGR